MLSIVRAKGVSDRPGREPRSWPHGIDMEWIMGVCGVGKALTSYIRTLKVSEGIRDFKWSSAVARAYYLCCSWDSENIVLL